MSGKKRQLQANDNAPNKHGRRRSSIASLLANEKLPRRCEPPPSGHVVAGLDPIKGYDTTDSLVVGTGAFAVVRLAKDTQGNYVAIKTIRSTVSPKRIAMEIKLMQHLSKDCRNIMPLLNGFRSGGLVSLVMPYIHFEQFRVLKDTLAADSLRCRMYICRLMEAIAHLHKHGIVHRDIKPDNFLCNFGDENGHGAQFFLSDFGLAAAVEEEEDATQGILSDLALPATPHSRAGTRGFRAPELLLQCSHSTKADVWSVGVIMLSAITGRYPFFQSPSDLDGLAEIAALLGSTPLKAMAWKYNKNLRLPHFRQKKPLSRICIELQQRPLGAYDNDAYDLLQRMLTLDPEKRISAADALDHPFLQPLRYN